MDIGADASGAGDVGRGNTDEEIGRADLDPQLASSSENCGVIPSRDHPGLPPRVDGGSGQSQLLGQASLPTAVDDLSMAKLILHGFACTKNSDISSTGFPDRPLSEKIVRFLPMTKESNPAGASTPIVALLREMREAAGLTIRDMSDEAGYENHNSYIYYETDFKGAELPRKHRDKIAPVLLKHGIPAEKVARLGRLNAEQVAQSDEVNMAAILKEIRELKELLLRALAPAAKRKTSAAPNRKLRAS